MNTVGKMLLLITIGALQTAKDSRQYYDAEFRDVANPFLPSKTRRFWQQLDGQGNPVWKGANPDQVKSFLNKQIPGEILTLEVEPYEIDLDNGETRTVNTYTAVVMGGELPAAVFKSLGRTVVSNEAEAAAIVEEQAAADVTIA